MDFKGGGWVVVDWIPLVQNGFYKIWYLIFTQSIPRVRGH